LRVRVRVRGRVKRVESFYGLGGGVKTVEWSGSSSPLARSCALPGLPSV